jgi:hypothetical protein
MILKRNVFGLAIAAAAVTGAPMVFASPFNPKDVAANPALLLHVDCDAIRSSSIGKAILSEPDVKQQLAAVGALVDFDVSTQLHGLTVYTTEAHPKDGALIVYADFDPKRLLTLAQAAEGFQGVTNGSHVIYSWVDDKKKGKEGERPRVFGAIAGHRVVFGQEESHLAEALEVMDGVAPGFSGKELPAAEAGESILLEGVLLKFDFDDANGQAAIFKMSKSVRLKLSEAASNMTAHVRFEAADTNTATQIASIAQGLLALLKLQTSDPDATKLANALAIKQDGPAVGLTISVPSSELTSDLDDLIVEGEKKQERKKAEKAEKAARKAAAAAENK